MLTTHYSLLNWLDDQSFLSVDKWLWGPQWAVVPGIIIIYGWRLSEFWTGSKCGWEWHMRVYEWWGSTRILKGIWWNLILVGAGRSRSDLPISNRYIFGNAGPSTSFISSQTTTLAHQLWIWNSTLTYLTGSIFAVYLKSLSSCRSTLLPLFVYFNFYFGCKYCV